MANDVFGVVVINASGNAGSSTGVGYPASHEKVLAIGATTQTDTRAGFSNHGPNLFMSAPGAGIWSTQLNGQYGSSSGTSFASPIVSGVVGLLFSVNPSLTPEQVKQILIDSSQKVGGYNYNWNTNDPGHSRELGYGRIDAFEAVQLANTGSGSCNITSITTSNISVCDDNGTAADPSDDTFTVAVTVTFSEAPTTGTLDLTGDGSATVSVTGLTSPHTFEGVIMDADGGPITTTATFSAETTCTLTIANAGTAPESCSTPLVCSVTDIATSNISDCDDNGTTSDPSDDTFTVDVTVTFSEAPTTGTLDLTGDGSASIDVAGISSPYTFEGVTMAADGSAIDVTATFSESTVCTLNNANAGTAPESCSILGIDDNDLTTIAIYPNPTDQNISLLNLPEELTATVYNLLGQQVINHKVGANDNTINVSGLSTGTYILKIEGYDQVLRFVKQ